MAAKQPTATKQLLPAAGEIKVRLYSQGLGDCFLLAFPRPGKPKEPCYFVIDCGAAMSTPGRPARAKRTVESLREATGGHIDVLAITHQHFDHISGFQDAWQEWQKIKVDALYLPWTEATGEKGEHSSTTDFRNVLDHAAQKALEALPDNKTPLFQAQAEFLGKGPKNMDETMAFIRNLCPGNTRYFKPGDVFRLPGTDSHGYVLGPPLPDKVNEKGKRFIELLVDGTDGVMYNYADFGMKVDTGRPRGQRTMALSDDRSLPALASGLLAWNALADPSARENDEKFSPFAPELRLDWDSALSEGFFAEHYANPWRKVDTDWLTSGAELALRAGDFTNNVSLVLAFDQPDSKKMLLFPGDAQVGNWLSWHTIDHWNFRDSPAASCVPPASDGASKTLMEDLLGRVAFYKVGHHGSHNATIKEKGLEKMTRRDLVAYIPVSIPVAQDLMSYCPMPFYPIVRTLQLRTAGRVFLPNGSAIEPLPEGKSQSSIQKESSITLAKETIPASQEKGVEEMPLFLEYRQVK